MYIEYKTELSDFEENDALRISSRDAALLEYKQEMHLGTDHNLILNRLLISDYIAEEMQRMKELGELKAYELICLNTNFYVVAQHQMMIETVSNTLVEFCRNNNYTLLTYYVDINYKFKIMRVKITI